MTKEQFDYARRLNELIRQSQSEVDEISKQLQHNKDGHYSKLTLSNNNITRDFIISDPKIVIPVCEMILDYLEQRLDERQKKFEEI